MIYRMGLRILTSSSGVLRGFRHGTTFGIISRDTEAGLPHREDPLSFPQVAKNLTPVPTSGNPPPCEPNRSWKCFPNPPAPRVLSVTVTACYLL